MSKFIFSIVTQSVLYAQMRECITIYSTLMDRFISQCIAIVTGCLPERIPMKIYLNLIKKFHCHIYRRFFLLFFFTIRYLIRYEMHSQRTVSFQNGIYANKYFNNV